MSIATRAAVVGLGMIGTPIARVLLAAGTTVTVWNRTPGPAEALVEAGARAAPTLRDALRAGPLVLLCLTDHTAVIDVLRRGGDAFEGRTVVNLATSTPEQAKDAAGRFANARAAYLAGSIMAVPETIGTSAGLLLHSGVPEAFDAHRAVLEQLGTAAFLGADPAAAALHDAALLGPTYALYAGYFQAVALLQAEGVAPTAFTRLLIPWLEAILTLLPAFADDIERADHRNAVSSLRLNRDAVANVLDVGARRGVPADALTAFRAHLDRRVDAGAGEEGLSSVVYAYAAGSHAEREGPQTRCDGAG